MASRFAGGTVLRPFVPDVMDDVAIVIPDAGVSRTSVRSVLTSWARACPVVVRVLIASPTLSVLSPTLSTEFSQLYTVAQFFPIGLGCDEPQPEH